VRLGDRVWGALFFALAVAILWRIRTFDPIPGQNVGPGAFPGLLAVALLGCSIALFVRGVKRDVGLLKWGSWLASPYHLTNFLAVVAALLFYIFFANKLGFLITASIILLLLQLKLRVKPWIAACVTVAIVFLIHLIFYKMLRVTLPWGVLPVLY
jgi:putative tricarboxylic transport membrane protein